MGRTKMKKGTKNKKIKRTQKGGEKLIDTDTVMNKLNPYINKHKSKLNESLLNLTKYTFAITSVNL